MTYKQQLAQWMRDHPDATPEEAYLAGYWQATTNWCNKNR